PAEPLPERDLALGAAGAPRPSPERLRSTTWTSRAPYASSRVKRITRGRGGPSWPGALPLLDGPPARRRAGTGRSSRPSPSASCPGSCGVAPRSDRSPSLDAFPGHHLRGGGAGSPRRGRRHAGDPHAPFDTSVDGTTRATTSHNHPAKGRTADV